jgi:hypothetical protein
MGESGDNKADFRAIKKMGVKNGSVNLKDWELIQQGAEARIYKGIFEGRQSIAKERFKKGYRHPALDSMLSSQRLRAEVKRNIKCRKEGWNKHIN